MVVGSNADEFVVSVKHQTVAHHGLFGVDLLRGGVGHLLDDGGDVCGAVQLQLGEAGLVGLHHTLDT